MPREIVTRDGTAFRFREYQLDALGPHDVRVRVQFAAPKHGTELQLITGSSFERKEWHPELRMFLPRSTPDQPQPAERPERNIGNMIVGVVSEVGGAVTRFRPGERVFGYGPIREVHQAPEDKLRPLGNLSEVDAVCVDPAHVAFVAVRDGNIRIGDAVAVFGLGAIGLLAVQIARAGGARKVFAVDPLPMRRAFAEQHGADRALDPNACDVALEIKRATGNKGVDVSIETSGAGRALHEAIRCLRQCGTVVHVPWGPKDCRDLNLSEEFHHNRPTIVGSQAWSGWENPDRSYPLWDHERAYQTTIELFRDGLITGAGVVTPIVSFEEAPEALVAIRERPETTIKFGVRF
ncbi:MAG: zinc-binding alcohol dehydrogenase [Candidatus Brachytrichaceae bacterium NZ_4S206]|jgi:threonine dehydrogenase-like Zn-dependent dehydrogenase